MFFVKYVRRLVIRHLCFVILLVLCTSFLLLHYGRSSEHLNNLPSTGIKQSDAKPSIETNQCNFKPSTDEFIREYRPNTIHGAQVDPTRAEPTVERLGSLLEIIHSKETQYQTLLDTFDVFDMSKPTTSFKAYTDQSNIDEIQNLYNRFIKLKPDKQSIEIDPSFIDYLKSVSGYLSDGLRDKRTKKFDVPCLRKPVFVTACNAPFFAIAEGVIESLDAHWPDHHIVFYDMGLTLDQRKLLEDKCKQCEVIDFLFTAIEKYAPHIRKLHYYTFKPFVVQDALRRYGTIIYGDASARFNEQSFNPVLIDNYLRGFAARELPGHLLPCYTRSGAFSWFNHSYSQFDHIYMAEANFLAVTDTFLSRLIMKTWLTCALDENCLVAGTSQTLCGGTTAGVHRYDQSAMVIILSYFFFQGNRSSWANGNANDPAPYDMFTSIQKKVGEIKRGDSHNGYLATKQIV